MSGNFVNFQTKYTYLTYLWNKKKIKDMKKLIKRVKDAEKKGILVVKRDPVKSDEAYAKNISWYLGQLERDRKINGFLGAVGRPPKIKGKRKRSVQRKV